MSTCTSLLIFSGLLLLILSGGAHAAESPWFSKEPVRALIGQEFTCPPGSSDPRYRVRVLDVDSLKVTALKEKPPETGLARLTGFTFDGCPRFATPLYSHPLVEVQFNPISRTFNASQGYGSFDFVWTPAQSRRFEFSIPTNGGPPLSVTLVNTIDPWNAHVLIRAGAAGRVTTHKLGKDFTYYEPECAYDFPSLHLVLKAVLSIDTATMTYRFEDRLGRIWKTRGITGAFKPTLVEDVP